MKHFMIILLVFATYIFSASYTVPKSAYSVYAEDLDLDGDNDIVVGHNYNSNTEWSGVSILENNGKGEFTLTDSIYLYSWQTNVYVKQINDDIYPDIIGRHYENDTQYMAVLENNQDGFDNVYHQMDYGIDEFTTGDIDGDNDIDLVFISNSGSFWGYMKNDGTGQYDTPVYYTLEERPSCIDCGDLNGDEIDDIIVDYGTYKLKIYYGKTTGFTSDEVSYFTDYTDIEITDYNCDGTMELIATGGVIGVYTELIVFSKNTEENYELLFTKQIDEAMTNFFISDLNNDTYPDVVYNCSYYSPNSEYEETHTYILFNESGTSFADPIDYQTYSGTSGPTKSIESFVADMDGSGTQDIVTVNYSYNDDNCINILFQDSLGNFVETSIDNRELIIENYKLEQNYPNPFNNETSIDYTIKNISDVEINVFNSNGQFIQCLVDSKQSKGMHSATFRADNLNSGIYYYRLKLEGVVKDTKKMLYLR